MHKMLQFCFSGSVPTVAEWVQRGDGGWIVGLPVAAHCLAGHLRLHQHRRRGRRRRRPAASVALRVLAAGLPRDGRRPRLLQPQAERHSLNSQVAVLLGAHQPRCCKYWLVLNFYSIEKYPNKLFE